MKKEGGLSVGGLSSEGEEHVYEKRTVRVEFRRE